MNKLTVKDIITFAILGLIMTVLQHGIGGILTFNMFVGMVLAPMIICFINAPIFMLMAIRIGKPYVFLIYAILVGIPFGLAGYWFVFLYFSGVGVICEFLIMRGEDAYKSPKRLTTLWTIYSALFIGSSIIPMWFMRETYVKTALEGGFSSGYVDNILHYFTSPLWLTVITLLSMIGGYLGSILGKKLLRRHFSRAGVI